MNLIHQNIEIFALEALKTLEDTHIGERDIDHVRLCLSHIIMQLESFQRHNTELHEWTRPLC